MARFLPEGPALAEVVAHRRAIHRHPELAFNEHATAALVESHLHGLGFQTERIAGTGVLAFLTGSAQDASSGPTILLRADMDALPIQERSERPWRSVNDGCMHACGHDGHTAILMGVARMLLANRDRLRGRVAFLFQPAEEGAGGANRVLEDGLLARTRAVVAGGLHLWSEAPTGQALITDGPFMASMDLFEIQVKGQGGHGAIPQSARDPVVAAAHMVTAFQTIASRSTDPLEAAVVTVARFNAGKALNVIPDSAELGGTTRSFSKATQDVIEARLRAIAAGTAATFGVEATVAYRRKTIPLVNAPQWADVARSVVPSVPGVTLGPAGYRTMGAEDMAFILDALPGVFFFLGAGNPAVGAIHPHHHPSFEIDEEALPMGVAMLSEWAVAALERLAR